MTFVQHAPGRFHSGAQVVKETVQAMCDRSRSPRGCKFGLRPGELCRFPINITGNPHD